MTQITSLRIFLPMIFIIVKSVEGYFLSNSSQDLLYIHALLLNQGPPSWDPNVPCEKDEDCLERNAICNSKFMCECRKYFEFDNLGICIDCPGEDHYCGYNNCCGGNLLRCYSGVCRQCMVDPLSMECITREQLMYATLSQISLALAMVLGILALLTLLYKACKRPSLMFGSSQRMTGNRSANARGATTIEDMSRTSISSTQRRVLDQLRDRPPRYEREPSRSDTTTVTPPRGPPNTPHVLGEPPPLYRENVSDTDSTSEQQIEPPPAYSASFPTIPIITFSYSNATGDDQQIKDEEEEKNHMESPSTSRNDVREDKSVTTDTNSVK